MLSSVTTLISLTLFLLALLLFLLLLGNDAATPAFSGVPAAASAVLFAEPSALTECAPPALSGVPAALAAVLALAAALDALPPEAAPAHPCKMPPSCSNHVSVR